MTTDTRIKVLSFEDELGITCCDIKFSHETFRRHLDFDEFTRFHVQPLNPTESDLEPWVRIGIDSAGSEVCLELDLETARTLGAVLSAVTLRDVVESERVPDCLTS